MLRLGALPPASTDFWGGAYRSAEVLAEILHPARTVSLFAGIEGATHSSHVLAVRGGRRFGLPVGVESCVRSLH